MTTATAIESPERQVWAAIEAHLRAAGLPHAGVDAAAHWLVVRRDGRIAGSAAVETYGDAGLLRSVAVDAAARGAGFGALLVRASIDWARAHGLYDLYLLTETADQWFPRFGFAPVAPSLLPPAIAACRHATDACASTAVAMRLRLGEDAA